MRWWTKGVGGVPTDLLAKVEALDALQEDVHLRMRVQHFRRAAPWRGAPVRTRACSSLLWTLTSDVLFPNEMKTRSAEPAASARGHYGCI